MVVRQKFVFSEFSFDCSTGELQRNGRRLRVPDQAARLLTILLMADGELISRDEIRQKLWPNGEFLDHDHSINKAISQLRSILRDEPQSPRFLETIPKRGYRFVRARVESLQEPMELESALGEPGLDDIPPKSEVPKLMPETFDVQATEPVATPTKGSHLGWWIAVSAAAVALVVLLVFTYMKMRPAGTRMVRIAIAPFEVTGDGSKEMAESLRMDLTDAISQLPEVQVRAAHSIQDTNTDSDSVRQVAKTMRVDTVIYGHLSLEANHFALRLELIRGADAVHLASFRYEGTRQELPSLRAKVQRDVFSRLALSRQGEEHALGRTNNPDAYEAYLRGRSLLEQRTNESLNAAMKEFKSAASADPHFAGAYAGMAHAEMILAEHGALPAAEAYQKTRELAQKALREDPSMSEAHGLLGYSAFRLDWNFLVAERELRQAIELDPNESVYHVWFSVLLCDEGRFDESFEQIDIAHAMEPTWAPIYLTETFLGASSRRYDRMTESAKRLVELMPDWPLSHEQLAWAYWFSGRSEDAVAEWRKMAVLEKDTARVDFEDKGLAVLRHDGRKAYSQVRLNLCLKVIASQHPNDFVAAEWYAYAGQKEKALKLLEETVSSRSQDALEITVNPAYFDMHSDPKFRELVMKVGLPMPPSYSNKS